VTRTQGRHATLDPGNVIPRHELVAISGERVAIPDGRRLVHLQFRRFAGCPLCDLHLRSVARRHDDVVAARICEVVVFHSTPRELADHASGFAFPVVADPDRRLYAEFGVGVAAAAMLHPRAWLPEARATIRVARDLLAKRRRLPALHPHGGHHGLPADFLIAPDGRVLARKYGVHAYDQWSVDELLVLAREPGELGR
jgi:peroxiredoxin